MSEQNLAEMRVGDTTVDGNTITGQETIDGPNGSTATLTTVEAPRNDNMLTEDEIEDIAASIHVVFDEPRLADLLITKLMANKRFHEMMVPMVGGMIQRIIKMHESVANNNIVVDFIASVQSDGSTDEIKVEFSNINGEVKIQRVSHLDQVWVGEEELATRLVPQAIESIRQQAISMSLEFTDLNTIYGKLFAKTKEETTAADVANLADEPATELAE